ncbi:MAG: class I SAM-dependent methyltransferase [Ilumatobacteraceae bacterium]
MSDPRTETFRAVALPAIEGVEGWLSEGQAERLWDAAARCPADGRIVEIGSFRGRSTVVLALAAPAEAELIAIDPHAGNDRGPQELDGFEDAAASDHEVFLANLARAGVQDRVRHLRAFSHDALGDANGPIDVLYIDGAHRYGPARQDIVEWGALVEPGGTMLIHDSFSSIGVTLAILRELLVGEFRYVGRTRSLAEYRRDAPASPAARGANALRQLAQLGWFVRNVALKVALSAGAGRCWRRLGRPEPEWPY